MEFTTESNGYEKRCFLISKAPGVYFASLLWIQAALKTGVGFSFTRMRR